MEKEEKSVLDKHVEEQTKLFIDVVGKENDRTLGIIVGCWLDQLLQKLIQAAYIKDSNVKELFKDDHILQNFSSKVNIAYFSGLIPKFLYHDLKIMGSIRNKFAHEPISELTFQDEYITQKLDSCLLRPKTMEDIRNPRLKFILIVAQMGALLSFIELTLSKMPLPKLMDIINMDKWRYEELAVTKQQLLDFINRTKPEVQN